MSDDPQNALFVQNRDIGVQDAIKAVVRKPGVDFDAWKRYNGDVQTKDAVEKDLRLAQQYGLHGVHRYWSTNNSPNVFPVKSSRLSLSLL